MDTSFEAYKAELHQMDVHLLDVWQIDPELQICYDLMADCSFRNNAGEDEENTAPSLEYLALKARVQYLEARLAEEAAFSVKDKYYWEVTEDELREELELRRKAIASASPNGCRQYQADIRKILKE